MEFCFLPQLPPFCCNYPSLPKTCLRGSCSRKGKKSPKLGPLHLHEQNCLPLAQHFSTGAALQTGKLLLLHQRLMSLQSYSVDHCRSEIRELRNAACDALVLREGQGPSSLLSHLEQMEKPQQGVTGETRAPILDDGELLRQAFARFSGIP